MNMIKVYLDKNCNVRYDKNCNVRYDKIKSNIVLLDWNNKICKFFKQGSYYYADYIRLVNDLPLKDKEQLFTYEQKVCGYFESIS